MKRLSLIFALCLTLMACGNSQSGSDKATEQPGSDRVEVLSFHAKQRCITCLTIEKLTKEVVDSLYADAINDSSLVFRSIDISQEENESIADKYEVTWSSLIIVKHHDGQETVSNLTDFAFTNARKSPDLFKDEVAKTIGAMLK